MTPSLLVQKNVFEYFYLFFQIAGGQNGLLYQYDLRNFNDAVNFAQPHSQNIQDLQMSHDQGLIISSSSDRTAQLHDAHSLEPLKSYK